MKILDVQWSWKQVCDTWSKMKDKYEFEKKKTQVISAPPLDWPWYEEFDHMFRGTTKINGQLLVVWSQINILTINPSFDHNYVLSN